MTTTQTDPTKEKLAVGAFLSAMHDQGLDGAKVREAMLEVLGLAALHEQAREGEAVAPNGKLQVSLLDTPTDIELARYKRMFEAACVALGEIGDALGCDPNEGGAEPILDAIDELKAQVAPQPAQPEHIPDAGKMVAQPEKLIGCVQHDCAECQARIAQPEQLYEAKESINALTLALEVERDAANLYAKQVAHWIGKHDALLEQQLQCVPPLFAPPILSHWCGICHHLTLNLASVRRP